MSVDNFALIENKIIIESSGVLYSINLDGSGLSKIDTDEKCTPMGCWNDVVYIRKGDRVAKLNFKKMSLKEVAKLNTSTFFIDNKTIYYIDEGGNLLRKKIKSKSSKTIVASNQEFYNLDPEFELINFSDKSRTVTTSCVDLYACNNTLYVLQKIDDKSEEYHLITKVTEVTKLETTYKWIAVSLKNDNVLDTHIKTKNITVFDDVVFDGYENKNQVIQ